MAGRVSEHFTALGRSRSGAQPITSPWKTGFTALACLLAAASLTAQQSPSPAAPPQSAPAVAAPAVTAPAPAPAAADTQPSGGAQVAAPTVAPAEQPRANF